MNNNSNYSIVDEIKFQQINSLTPNKNSKVKKRIIKIENNDGSNEENSKDLKDILSSNINSDSLNISIPKLITQNIKNQSREKNENSKILLLKRLYKKNKKLFDKNNLTDSLNFEYLSNKNLKMNNILSYNSDSSTIKNINKNNVNLDDLYEISNLDNKLNKIYTELNHKINKLSKQFKNLSNEVCGFIFAKKLINKRKNFSEFNYLNINFPQNNIFNNQNIELSYKSKSLSNKENNLNSFSDIHINNGFINTEEPKINPNDLLKKIDSFLVKKFKE